MMSVNLLVEGITDEPVAKKLLRHVGLEVGMIYGRKGKSYVLERASVYNKAASRAPWFVLIDLDMDTQCASEALNSWLPEPTNGMRFRIAVRAVEAWLIVDRESTASFLSVNLAKIPYQVDRETNPKMVLINIARTSRNRSVREDIVPRDGGGAKVGPLYVARLTDFTENYWRPDEGMKHSESLRRCINVLSTLKSFTAT